MEAKQTLCFKLNSSKIGYGPFSLALYYIFFTMYCRLFRRELISSLLAVEIYYIAISTLELMGIKLITQARMNCVAEKHLLSIMAQTSLRSRAD